MTTNVPKFPETIYVSRTATLFTSGGFLQAGIDPTRYAEAGQETEAAVYKLVGTVIISAKVVVSQLTPHEIGGSG